MFLRHASRRVIASTSSRSPHHARVVNAATSIEDATTVASSSSGVARGATTTTNRRAKHEEAKSKDPRCQHDWTKPFHASPLPLDQAGGLLEYSVVYTDRAMNHMSKPFCDIMKNLNESLKEAYNATSVVIMPGSGTYGMEAVARQWCTGKKALVLRNGYFSYRWTDIFEQTNIPSETIVMRGQPVDPENAQPHFAPAPIEEVVKTIMAEKPAVVFAPHVETSTGIILPDDYIKQVATAVHAHGGLFVLDCIASGHVWVDMKETGVDAILSAPQKGWTGPACSSVIMLGERGTHATRNTTSTSMVINMRKWLEVMDSYVNGGFAYYTTMPTDALALFNGAANETKKIGFDKVKQMAWDLGNGTRKMMESKGLKSVAAPGFQAPGVVVSYTPEPNMFNIFKSKGMQIAAGVPFMINEPAGNFTFRIGLFGLDKVVNKDRTINILEDKLDEILPEIEKAEAEKMA